MNKVRKYVWKAQIRASNDQPWRDVKSETDKTIYIIDGEIQHPNAFYIKDGAPIPPDAYRVYGYVPSSDYFIREILEGVGDDGKPLIKVIREYSKMSRGVVKIDDGVTYAICKYEDCGAKIVPQRASQHLREVHGIRQKIANTIDYTDEKYFTIVLEHGNKARGRQC